MGCLDWFLQQLLKGDCLFTRQMASFHFLANQPNRLLLGAMISTLLLIFLLVDVFPYSFYTNLFEHYKSWCLSCQSCWGFSLFILLWWLFVSHHKGNNWKLCICNAPICNFLYDNDNHVILIFFHTFSHLDWELTDAPKWCYTVKLIHFV